MVTYHLAIHLPMSSFANLDTYCTKDIPLESEEEFETVKRLCENPKNMAGGVKQLFIPIRTDALSDLFFPILMNGVMKIKSVADSCLAVLIAILMDVVTLPIRLITYIPRWIHNNSQPRVNHPLIPYLINKGLPANFHIITGASAGRESFVEENGRVNIDLFTKKTIYNQIRSEGFQYALYLTDREIPFHREKQPFYRNHFPDPPIVRVS